MPSLANTWYSITGSIKSLSLEVQIARSDRIALSILIFYTII